MRQKGFLGIVLLFSLTAMPLRGGAQTSEDDILVIRSWVELPYGIAVGNSFIEKQIYRAGDSIALAVIQGFSQDELLDKDRIERLLPILEVAFEHPSSITRKPDRKPRATLLLLDFLENRMAEKALKEKIAATKKAISTKASSA
jgi:hypothetical protein